MPGFCVQCGSPLAAGARFCEGCGGAVSGTVPARPAQPAPTTAPTAAAAVAPSPVPAKQGSNTAVKVIMIVVAIFVFLSLMAAGSCFYIAYRVKKRAHQFATEIGGNAAPYTGSKEACGKLSAREVSAILGQPVQSAEPSGNGCEYHVGANGGQVLAIEYTWEGAAITMGLTRAAMKNAVAGMQTLETVNGIGDEAYVLPMGSGLLMRKGDVMVHIDNRVSGISVDKMESMGRAIAGRL
jgi:hypothetical protein